MNISKIIKLLILVLFPACLIGMEYVDFKPLENTLSPLKSIVSQDINEELLKKAFDETFKCICEFVVLCKESEAACGLTPALTVDALSPEINKCVNLISVRIYQMLNKIQNEYSSKNASCQPLSFSQTEIEILDLCKNFQVLEEEQNMLYEKIKIMEEILGKTTYFNDSQALKSMVEKRVMWGKITTSAKYILGGSAAIAALYCLPHMF